LKNLQFAWIVVSATIIGTCSVVIVWTLAAPPPKAAADGFVLVSHSPAPSVLPNALSRREPSIPPAMTASLGARLKDLSRVDVDKEDDIVPANYSPDARAQKPNLSYLVYYVYAELAPDRKPADIALDSIKDIPVGTPVEEIKRAADAFGLDFNFMRAVAKIESDFDPKQRTGSYIGLYQLNKYEFNKYGSGEITSPRDNAIAAAYKFVTEATLFEWETHKKASFSDLYLIHQQGWQGAAEHVAQPDRLAWKSMCATDEGREKGEKWCRRAVWGNTLPAVKKVWKSVDKLTSGEFVSMWRQRVDRFYARYTEASAADTKH
jgi:Transglycosylase SLT domain